MKKVKILLFIVIFFSAFLFTGCEQIPTDPNENEPPIYNLDAPTNLHITEYSDKQILFFDLVENAANYQINFYVGQKLTQRLVVSQEDAILGIVLNNLEAGEYTITIKALAADNSSYLDSNLSEQLNVTITSSSTNPQKYTVTFNSNGGTQVTSQIVSSGNKAKKPTNPQKSGYEFVCWLLNGVEFDFDTIITKDITLDASWKKSDGGTIDDDLMPYYESVKGLTGSALKAKLRQIISNAKTLSYSDLTKDTGLPFTDADPEKPGNIILFYGHVSVKASSTWNREHVWPKSRGWFKTSGAGSDIHHIRPEDNDVNSRRGNLVMGKVSNGKQNLYDDGTLGGYYGSLYEPVDSVKGDVARIYMYMLIRYSQTDSSYPITNVISSMALLLEWHLSDPVDEFEKLRNERSYQVQGNRNPFIDYPEFAEMIWG